MTKHIRSPLSLLIAVAILMIAVGMFIRAGSGTSARAEAARDVATTSQAAGYAALAEE